MNIAEKSKIMRAKERAENPLELYWISFADGDGFRGVCVVKAHGFVDAVWRTHEIGTNPQGQAAGGMVCEDPDEPLFIPWLDKLLTFEEASALAVRIEGGSVQ